MVANSTKWIFSNFDLCMFILAILFMSVNSIVNKQTGLFEIVYRWFSLFPVGITLIYVSIMRAFFPELTEATLGWRNSPCQYEMALAALSFGIVAVLSFKASYGFRLATVISSSVWLLGNAINRIHQVNLNPSLASGTGSWLLLDIVLPLLLFFALFKLRSSPKSRY